MWKNYEIDSVKYGVKLNKFLQKSELLTRDDKLVVYYRIYGLGYSWM